MRIAAPILLPVLMALVLVPVSSAAAAEIDSMRTAAEALRSEDPSMRARAVEWLGARKTAAERRTAGHLLIPMVEDPTPPVRQRTWNALAAIEARAHVPALTRRILVEPSRDVLGAALIALGRLGRAEQVAAAIDRLAREHTGSVQAAALMALARLGAPQAAARARDMLVQTEAGDPAWRRRASAMLVIARSGSRDDALYAAKIYADTQGHRFWFARSAYARLVATHMPDQITVLLGLSKDEDMRVAVTAAEGLARAGHSSTLLGLLRSSDSRVRSVAVAAVAQARLAEGYARLRYMAREDMSRRVRWATAKALWQLQDPLGDRLMLVAIGSREPAIWAEAVALLARRTGADHGRNLPAWREELRRLRSR